MPLNPKCKSISATITTPNKINKVFKGINISTKLKELAKLSKPFVIVFEKSFKERPGNSVGNLPTVLSKNQTMILIKKSKIDIFYLKKCFM